MLDPDLDKHAEKVRFFVEAVAWLFGAFVIGWIIAMLPWQTPS